MTGHRPSSLGVPQPRSLPESATVEPKLEEPPREQTGSKQSHTIHHYVYVDNLRILSVDRKSVKRGLEQVEDILDAHHLILHPGVSSRALGCDLRGDLMASRVAQERYHRLRQVITGLLNRRKVSGRLLEVIVGHATFVGS